MNFIVSATCAGWAHAGNWISGALCTTAYHV